MAPPQDGGGAAASATAASSFPQVSIAEILESLHQLHLPWVTAEDITKPTQQAAYLIYMQWLEALCGVNQDWIHARKAEVLLDFVDHRELYEESLAWLIFYREVATLMQAARVQDFTSADILKPQGKRFRKHLSALVNFHRFRDERALEYDKYTIEVEELVAEKEDLLTETADLRDRIRAIREQREGEVPRTEQVLEQNVQLHDALQELKKEQTQLLSDVDKLKEAKQSLFDEQQELSMEQRSTLERVMRLKARVQTNPRQLKESLRALTQELRERKAHLADTERRAKDFEGRIALMRAIEEDLSACQNLLLSLGAEQARLEGVQREVRALEADYDDTHSAYSQKSQTLSADTRQLENAKRRWERMRTALDEKRLMWKKREEDFTRKWEETEGERWKRSEEANTKTREAREMEREIEAELRVFDAEVAAMVKQRNDLVRLAEAYMEAITETLDMDGQGLVADVVGAPTAAAAGSRQDVAAAA